MAKGLVSAPVSSSAVLRHLRSGDLDWRRKQGARVCFCVVMMPPVTPTYCFCKHRAMRDPVALPEVKQTCQLQLISVWEAITQLTDLPEVPAEASWPLPVTAWDSEAAQPRR